MSHEPKAAPVLTDGSLTEAEAGVLINEEAAAKRSRSFAHYRFSAIWPTIFAFAAFVLVVILLVSGSKPGSFQDYDVMALNTSNLGQQLVTFGPATVNKAKRVEEATTYLNERFTDPFTALGDFFSGLISNATSLADNGLNSAEATLVKNALDSIGLQEYYSMHLQDSCSGTLSSKTNPLTGTTDLDSQFVAKQCLSYGDASGGLSNLTSSIPSSFTVATTNVSVPILGTLSSVSGYLSSTISTLTRTVFAFYIIGAIGAGITMLLSPVALFLRTNRILLYTNLFFSSLAATFLFAASIGVTVLVTIIANVVNSVGNSIGLIAYKGTKFLTLTWVAWVLMLLAACFWFAVWFVEVRSMSFKLRRRTGAEIGNWREMPNEIRGDFKRDWVLHYI